MARKKKEDPPSKDYTGLVNHRKNAVQVESLFNQSKRILKAMLNRLEEHMFVEANLEYDASLARQAKALADAVGNLASAQERLQKAAKEAADLMTMDEKIEAMCDFIESQGRNNRLKIWKALHELEYELEAADKLSKSQPE